MKRLLTFALAIILVTAFFSFAYAGEQSASKKSKHEDKKEEKGCCQEKCHKYNFKFSGFFKTDVIYDQNRAHPGNFALWVPHNTGGDEDAMHLTTRETRLGFDFSWVETDVRTDARLEFDFYNAGAAENKAAPMLRHAYLKTTKGHWSLLAGQTSDVISPLVPKTVNYTVCWAQGNIGYRRPQFRISTWAGLGDKTKIKAAVAATRTLGSDLDQIWDGTVLDSLGDEIDDGIASALPTVQGRLGLVSEFGESGSASIGFSGHYGREEYKILVVGESKEYTNHPESWSANVDLELRLNDKLAVSGEYFVGQNLATYFGGVSQTVNPLYEEISAMGGWGMASMRPIGSLAINVGYSFDDPDDEDFEIPAYSTKSFRFTDLNTVIFGNLMYGITDNVTAMLEVSQLKTSYVTLEWDGSLIRSTDEDFDDLRIQFAMKAAID